MQEEFSRTARLIGEAALERLAACHVAVFGIGGVGGYVCEALVRSGIGHFDLIDKDAVDITNLNRQIIALRSTVGRSKTEVMRERMLDISPEVKVSVRNTFFLPENADSFDFSAYDYVVDAVDTVSAKLELAVRCQAAGTPLISSMGAGNKLDPTAFRVADIYKTNVDPLARVMRRELKKRGINSLKVVYSEEPPAVNAFEGDRLTDKTAAALPPVGAPHVKPAPGSIAFIPSVVGLIIAGEVVKDLCYLTENGNGGSDNR